MKLEIIGVAHRQSVGYMVTVKCTPTWLGKLFGSRVHTRKLFSQHTNIWYDADTLEEVSYMKDSRLRYFLNDNINENKDQIIKAIKQFDA